MNHSKYTKETKDTKDIAFMLGMTIHHLEGIEDSKHILETTQNPKVIEFANKLIKSQTKDIDKMKKMLSEYDQNIGCDQITKNKFMCHEPDMTDEEKKMEIKKMMIKMDLDNEKIQEQAKELKSKYSQMGGSIDDAYMHKYLKYKRKYIDLKDRR